MAPKMQLEPAPKVEPAAKKLKVVAPKSADGLAEPKVKDAEMADAEASREQEKDAPKDTRATVKDTPIAFLAPDSTLNVIPTASNRVLMALTDGGMQFLIAGARGSVGVKAGRYMFEVNVIEALSPQVPAQNRSIPLPRQLVRVGFSRAGSSLILDGEDSVGFDSEGSLFSGGKTEAGGGQRFGREHIVAVVLNLDPKSANFNTISLFLNGKRATKPVPLAENLRGKPLFPHVSYRNVSVQVHFGPKPLKPLPFQCRCLQDAARDDSQVAQHVVPKDGKYDVIFPVGFPDEGTFDWLDGFLEEHPEYVELSDRKLKEWALKSGLWQSKEKSWKASGDRPDFNFNIPTMDDRSAVRGLNAVAAVVPRHYVVMEVKSNLVKADRVEALQRFNRPFFRRVARVVMGTPSEEYRARVQKHILDEKQANSLADYYKRKKERDRKKVIEARAREVQELQRKAVEKKKQEIEEARKKAEEEKKAAEGELKMDESKDDTEKKDPEADAAKEGNKEGEPKDEKKEEPAEEDEEEDGEPPVVELTPDEKKIQFKTPAVPDLTEHVLTASFAQFTIPEQDEGFDQIIYDWDDQAKSTDYLRKWVLKTKITSRINDLQPSEWFRTKCVTWDKQLAEWQAKQKEWKAKKDEHKSVAADNKDGTGETEAKDGEGEKADIEDRDLFTVEDVCNIGKGEPLFAHFDFEDWELFILYQQLYLLTVSYKRDVNDPERIGIHESLLLFYYSRYFRRQLNPKQYGKETVQELIELVKGALEIDKENCVLRHTLAEETDTLDIFVKHTEESRRERQRRLDAGDETVRLNFTLLKQMQNRGWGGAATPAASGQGQLPPGALPPAQVLPPSGAPGSSQGAGGSRPRQGGLQNQGPNWSYAQRNARW